VNKITNLLLFVFFYLSGISFLVGVFYSNVLPLTGLSSIYMVIFKFLSSNLKKTNELA